MMSKFISIVLFAQNSAIILYKGLYVRVKSDVPKYSVFLDDYQLVSDVSRKGRVALERTKFHQINCWVCHLFTGGVVVKLCT